VIFAEAHVLNHTAIILQVIPREGGIYKAYLSRNRGVRVQHDVITKIVLSLDFFDIINEANHGLFFLLSFREGIFKRLVGSYEILEKN